MKVFLSSTAQDLEAYRQVADDTILRLSQQTVAMERFGPLPGTPVEECERLARESDVVVCVVAHRYGFVPEKGKGSITEREIRAAMNAGKDVLVWIVEDNHPWTEKREQDLLADPNVLSDPARVTEVAEHVAALIAFKAWLRTTFTPETFTTPDDLGKKTAVGLSNYIGGHSAPPLPQDRISISRLPTSGAELFGREAELQVLGDAWANENTNIVTFVAWGGVGKTALVNHWLKKRMARDNYRGAERVYGWSFFSQGTSERAASADLFTDQALRWFGDKDPNAGSPWDKGERLAGYLRQTRTLLILDGLEPLQHPPGPNEGTIKDAAMQALLVELAAHQPGLCVISTRERVGDLNEFEGSTVVRHNLEHLSMQAGAEILRSLNVKGDDDELEQASREFEGHAFSLTLLGSYLDEVFQGDVGRRREIENLFDDTRYGEKAQAMIAAYERWLGEGMELAILRLLGLFDRPADAASIGALREPPAISELTEPLQHFKAREWNQALAKLRRIKLVGEISQDEPGTLDAHPLLREHFKQQLKRERPDAWREGNNRLYEYLKTSTEEFPDTIEEMSPLFAAVIHGCNANEHVQVIKDVLRPRIMRWNNFYCYNTLGAFGTVLSALSGFFEVRWRQTIDTIGPSWTASLLGDAGSCLRSLGRLREATEPLSAGVKGMIVLKNWELAADAAVNLTNNYQTIGDLGEAIKWARQSVDLADRSTVPFERFYARMALVSVLQQTGRTKEAVALYQEAKALDPGDPTRFMSIHIYCELLIEEGEIQTVKDIATREIERAQQPPHWLFDGLARVALGRAFLAELLKNQTNDSTVVKEMLQQGVDNLRASSQMDQLPYGLLARAEFYRFIQDYDHATRDLTAVYRIASRSGMGLFLADYHLQSARLQLAQGDKDKAREHSTTAKEMIDRMGYHQRDKELEKIEDQLAS